MTGPLPPYLSGLGHNSLPAASCEVVIKGTFVAHEYRPLASAGLEPWKKDLHSLSAS
jgi:hypothetical protein